MDENTQKQAGAWLAMVADTQLYGGQMTDESKKAAENLLSGFDKLPQESKTMMKDAMSPMLDEMKKSEPSLYEKATGIAGTILGKLKKSFDINSPSRKTRSIFNNVMKGAEMGLDDEKDSLFKRVNVIGKGVLTQFDMTKPGGLSSIYQRMQQSIGCEVGRLSAAIGINTNGALLASASTSGYNNAAGIPSSGNIKTVLNIDGREFAVATSGYMSEELAWRNT